MESLQGNCTTPHTNKPFNRKSWAAPTLLHASRPSPCFDHSGGSPGRQAHPEEAFTLPLSPPSTTLSYGRWKIMGGL